MPRQISGAPRRNSRRRIFAFWLSNRSTDWVLAGCFGAAIRFMLLPLIHLENVDSAIRFSAYAASAAGMFAFVAVAFTPLAIMTALGSGSNLDRIRTFGADIRQSFLNGTLVLLLCAFVTIGCGVADATQTGSSVARLVASIAIALAGSKIFRLTELFSAILGANDRDQRRPERHRRRQIPA